MPESMSGLLRCMQLLLAVFGSTLLVMFEMIADMSL
jgi:hypothetical protein